MSHASSVVEEAAAPSVPTPRPPSLFRSLVLTERESHAGRTSATLVTSVILHAALVVAVAALPLLFYDTLPAQQSLRAFFVSPIELQPPPPPPPPPPAGARSVTKPAPQVSADQPQGFVAPIEVPAEIQPEEGLDLGIEGGVPGGVEGGVPGGVVGGVVGGLPDSPAPPPQRAIRVGGNIKAPTKIKDVAPIYPKLALDARVQGIVILECTVSPQGKVTDVKVLRSIPILDQAAMDAVKQWTYTPTLLNGVPVPVIMTVTVTFQLV